MRAHASARGGAARARHGGKLPGHRPSRTAPVAGFSTARAGRLAPGRRRAVTVGGMASSSRDIDHDPPTPTRLTARSPEDLLAVVPVVLGFVPAGLGRDADLRRRPAPSTPASTCPAADEDLPEVVDAAARPGLAHRVGRVVFVLYADAAPRRAAAWPTRCVAAFARAGIEVVDVLRADGAAGSRCSPAARGARAGRALRRRARTRSPPRRSSRAGSPTARATSWPPSPQPAPTRWRGWPRPGAAPGRAGRAATTEVVGAATWCGAASPARTAPDDDEAARLLVGVAARRSRDAGLALMTRDNGAGPRRALDRPAARAPDDLVAAPAPCSRSPPGWPATVRWRGARVDRCRQATRTTALAGLVGGLLVPTAVAAVDRGRRRAGTTGGPSRRSPRLPDLGFVPWAKRSRHRSSPGPTGRGTARRCAAASTCSRGCCARRASTPTTR